MSSPDIQLAISIYLYHPDMWEEIFSLLKNISTPYKLYIGLCTETLSASLEFKIKEDLILLGNPYTITYHENYGSDISAFLHHLEIIQEPYFIKIHSKKSKLGENKQINWFRVLVNDLIGSESIVYNNLYRLQTNKKLGLLANKENIKNNLEHTSANHIKHILSILNIDYEQVKNGSFISGTMFMSRTAIYKTIFSKKILVHIDNLLKHHRGKLSDNIVGTYAHAMERIFGYIVSYQNYFIKHVHNSTMPINDHKKNIHHDLVIMYNDECYIRNFIGTCGKIIKKNISQDFVEYTILWYDKNQTIKNYIIKNNTKKHKFDPIAYSLRNPDLHKMNYKELYNHYHHYGIRENRFTDLYIPKDTNIKTLKHKFINSFRIQRNNKDKPSIVLINHDVSLTGAPIYLYNLYNYLIDYTIYDSNQIYMLESYPNTLLPTCGNMLYHFNDINLLKFIFKKLNVGVIYSNSLNFYAANLGQFPELIHKTFLHFHEDPDYINKWITAPHVFSIPDFKQYKIGVVSQDIKTDLITKYSQFSDPDVCPPFLSLSKIDIIKQMSKTKNEHDPVLNVDKSKPIICMCGSLCSRKNPKLFLDISKKYKQYEFVWIGGDPKILFEEQINNLYGISNSSIPDNFHWIPYTNNPYYYMNLSDYLFLTSTIDPCPTIVLEALTLNKNIIMIHDNILTKHHCELTHYLYSKNNNDIIQEFGRLHITKNETNDFGHNYILNNFSKPNLLPVAEILHNIR